MAGTVSTVDERAANITAVRSLNGSYGSLLNRCGFCPAVTLMVYSSVWPSAGARTTSIVPRMLDAPGLFSTSTVVPSDVCNFDASSRAWMSV